MYERPSTTLSLRSSGYGASAFIVLPMRDFVHLHVHSHYSLLEAIPKIEDLVARALRDGQTALALTDNGNMYGAVEFYKECKEKGIQPIIGVDFFVAPRTRHDKEHRTDDYPSRLVLLAKNERGYKNLIQLVSKSYLEGFYARPRIARELIETLPDFSFISRARAIELFKDIPEALDNTLAIAKRCQLELHLGQAIFPTFPIPQGSSDNAELRKLAEAGIEERGLALSPALRERIDYELGIIAQKGYASYFLIVSDLLAYARQTGIFTNTRGSAAGSLVSYLCGITTVDPIKFNMPFERFLNPERPSAPDIDMDIADNRRDELIAYARQKYGDTHVVQIGTFGTMMARAAEFDVARALGHSYGTGDAVAKLIPFVKQGFPVTIKGALAEVPELEELYRRDAEAREILDLAQKIEGNARHVGVHAAGVILAPHAVTDYAPIQLDPKGGKTITQYDMYSIADEYGGVGLLKFDFLGLTNLSVLADSVARVKERLSVDVDLERIPLDDKKVYDMLTRGETLGVFQMAGSGMTAYLKDLRPTVVHDLNAMVALYRPGPMAFIPEYIA